MPHNQTVAPGRKLCRKRLHVYDASLRTCPDCERPRKAAHHAKNREKYRLASSERYYANHDKAKAIMAEYRDTHREEIRQFFRKRYSENADEMRAKGLDYARRNKERAIWRCMLFRCQNVDNWQYPDYGGRGITVCDRWQGEDGFKNFFADMGPRPSIKHSIDRRENDKGYNPDNCYWATPEQQARNTRRNKMVTFQGRTQCVVAWAEEVGIKAVTLSARLRSPKWTIERALTEKPRMVRKYA